MDYVKWLGKNTIELKKIDEFEYYFAFANAEEGDEDMYLTNTSLGISASFGNSGELNTLFFFSEGYQGYSQFKDALPFDLNFKLSTDEVVNLLGAPHIEGGNDYSLLYGITPKYYKYQYRSCDLHLQFGNQEEFLQLVTLMTPGLV